MSFYAPQPCPSADACINLFYKDGQGFKCVPADQTFAAVVIGGQHWNSGVDVLKADLNRCDGMIPTTWYNNKNAYRHKVTLLLFFPTGTNDNLELVVFIRTHINLLVLNVLGN